MTSSRPPCGLAGRFCCAANGICNLCHQRMRVMQIMPSRQPRVLPCLTCEVAPLLANSRSLRAMSQPGTPAHIFPDPPRSPRIVVILSRIRSAGLCEVQALTGPTPEDARPHRSNNSAQKPRSPKKRSDRRNGSQAWDQGTLWDTFDSL